MPKIAITLEQAKDRFRKAHRFARRDHLTRAFIDRLAAETLMLAKGQPIQRSATMLVRMAVALEVLADRRRWPEHITGIDVDRRPARARPAITA